MPELEPVYYDAIERVIEGRHENAEWDPDEMSQALLEVAKGEKQTEVVEDRGFSQPVLSEKWNDVKQMVSELKSRREGGSGLFRDPIDEAVSEFESFFGDLNDKYDMGINGITIQMMVDEIEQNEELPRPRYVKQFLNETASGVSKTAELDYIERRYRSWLENYLERTGGMSGQSQTGGFGGPSVGGGERQTSSQGNGVPVGQGQPQSHGQSQQQSPEDDRIARLEKQVEKLTEVVASEQGGGQQQGMVAIEQEDGSTMQVPMDHPYAMQMMMGNNDDDFFDKLQQAKSAGIIAGPEHLEQAGDDEDLLDQLTKLKEAGIIDDDDAGDEMAEQVAQAIESLGSQQMQAQQQMSQNMQAAIESIKEMQEETEELTVDKVEDIIDTHLTKSETEKLRDEFDEKVEEVKDAVEKTRQDHRPGVRDPEYLKKDREYQFREKQLDNVTENLRYAADQMTELVQTGMVPALREIDFDSASDDNELWEPPQNQQGTQEPSREAAPQRRMAEGQDIAPEEPQQDSGAEEPPESSVDEEYAQSVRGKLGLESETAPGGEA